MKLSITTAFLGGIWLGLGLFVAFNGIVVFAAALVLSRVALNYDLNALPAPLDFVFRNALAIGPIQFLVGFLLSIGGFALSEDGRRGGQAEQVLFPASLPIVFGLIVLGSSVWALSRQQITAELTHSK